MNRRVGVRDRLSCLQLLTTAQVTPRDTVGVDIRLTHSKKPVAEHRVIMAAGVIEQVAPSAYDAGADAIGPANAAQTRLAASRYSHGALGLSLVKTIRRSGH